jgi:hypothetical protein
MNEITSHSKLSNSTLGSSDSSAGTSSTKLTDIQNEKDSIDDSITINEKVSLTKKQHHVFKIICDTYEMSLSEYIQQALIEAMRFDIVEGNFSDALLEKIGSEDTKKDNKSSPSPAPDLMKSDLDLLKKLQTQI